MRHGHEVGFGRQLVGRVAPVAVHEGAELARFDELFQAVLDVTEVAGRRQRQLEMLLGQRRGGFRIGLQRRTTSTQSSACRW